MDIFGTHMIPPLLWDPPVWSTDDLLGGLWLTKNFPVDLAKRRLERSPFSIPIQDGPPSYKLYKPLEILNHEITPMIKLLIIFVYNIL